MTEYIASDNLIELLIKSGFTEVTELYFPHCHVRLQLKGERYHPAYFQRAFRYGSGPALVILNYLSIRVMHKSYLLAESRRLNEGELKAIISFCKLSPKQQALLAHRVSTLAGLEAQMKSERRVEPVDRPDFLGSDRIKV
ncbi:MAG: hypothetical protein QM669_05175 [Siphonobacter sp.]